MDGQDQAYRLRSAEGFEFSRTAKREVTAEPNPSGRHQFTRTTREIIALADDAGVQFNTQTTRLGTKASIIATRRLPDGTSVCAGPIVLDRTVNPRNTQPRLHASFEQLPSVVIGTPLFDIPITDPQRATELAAETLAYSARAVEQAIEDTHA